MGYFEQAQELLKQNGYRMTQTRHQVLSLFADTEKMLMPDEVQGLAGDTKLDSATVYRILNVLEELEIVKKIHSLGGYVKVPLNRPNILYRQFLIDEETHRAVSVPLVDVDSTRSEKQPGFSAKKIYAEVIGSFDEIDSSKKIDQDISIEKNITTKTITEKVEEPKTELHDEEENIKPEPSITEFEPKSPDVVKEESKKEEKLEEFATKKPVISEPLSKPTDHQPKASIEKETKNRAKEHKNKLLGRKLREF